MFRSDRLLAAQEQRRPRRSCLVAERRDHDLAASRCGVRIGASGLQESRQRLAGGGGCEGHSRCAVRCPDSTPPCLDPTLHLIVGDGSACPRIGEASIHHPGKGQLTKYLLIGTVVRLFLDDPDHLFFCRGHVFLFLDVGHTALPVAPRDYRQVGPSYQLPVRRSSQRVTPARRTRDIPLVTFAGPDLPPTASTIQ